jgi:light-regulated signal transduction histidine kinase (bacteriophytochrome)
MGKRDQDRIELLEEELQALREEYEEFAYIVSHDMGAPIRHIGGFTEMVLRDIQDQFDEKTLKRLGFVQ